MFGFDRCARGRHEHAAACLAAAAAPRAPRAPHCLRPHPVALNLQTLWQPLEPAAGELLFRHPRAHPLHLLPAAHHPNARGHPGCAHALPQRHVLARAPRPASAARRMHVHAAARRMHAHAHAQGATPRGAHRPTRPGPRPPNPGPLNPPDHTMAGGKWLALLWFIVLGPVLLITILIHELGHSLAARSVGGSAQGILLWPLGGLAFIHHNASPKGGRRAGGPPARRAGRGLVHAPTGACMHPLPARSRHPPTPATQPTARARPLRPPQPTCGSRRRGR